MEEPRKEDITEEVKEEQKDQETQPGTLPVKSCILMCFAGIYLVYTGYRLCSNVLNGVDGASWGFMIAGIAFLIAGIGMLIVGGKGVIRDDKEKKALAAAQKAEQEANKNKAPAGGETAEKQGAAGKMSIADRANLVKKINEEEDAE
ncbi:hypothetical protein [Ruminococcus sp. 5_1_39BFAA]|uniref:hypothetical protein n=1 Tax=Ruminococcus sp. 5_1_39BFAA TaxID=457412 RepID=UPI0035665940